MDESIEMNWWPELRAHVPPMRGEGAVTHPPASSAAELLGDAVPKKLRVALEGASDETAFLQAQARVLGAFWQHAIDAPSKAMAKRADALADRWFFDHGARKTIALLPWLPTHAGTFEIGGPIFGLTGNAADCWLLDRLRTLLAHAPDYDEALEWAQSVVTEWAADGIAAACAFLFPDHRPFFEAAVTNAPLHENLPNYLFASVTEPEDLALIMNGERARQFWSGEYGLHLAKRFGPSGYALMRRYLWDDASEDYARAISPYAGESVATDMLRFLDERSTRPVVQDYFAHNPRWLPLLEAASVGKKAPQKAAAKILEKLRSA